ncbi:MAG TPA: glucose 1-dehydrogenase, partial [Acidimicrobiia bacterium]|nr:glucose 1-dehydrogenase [Acidimicrobiia bacterium]
MKAVTVIPGDPGSLRLDDIPDPRPGRDDLLVSVLMAGICGTDHEILEGDLGYPPSGRDRLTLGHEALGRVRVAPDGSPFAPGDLVAPIVRRPDPVPCPNCAAGEWDMCRNGRFTEAGIRGLDGYTAEMLALPVEFAVKVGTDPGLLGVLVEPASVVAKAWEHIMHIGGRARWAANRVLVTGAGPIGLLAALFATRVADEIHVLDRAANGPKPGLVGDLGAVYHDESLDRIGGGFDVVLECTGDPDLMMSVPGVTNPNGIVCLAGVADEGRELSVGSDLVRSLVLENQTVFGTVNANRRHYEEAARVLAEASQPWLGRLISRRVPLSRFDEAYVRHP